MRIALLSDIHGNTVALDAVLTDMRKQGHIDEHWILGDLVAIGPDPVGVLEALTALENIRVLRGNTDRYVAEGKRPQPAKEQRKSNKELLPIFEEVSASFAWTQGAITASGWLHWLRNLPLEERLTLPDGTRLLGVHASPGKDTGPGIHPGLSEAEITALMENSKADLVCVAHTHWPMELVIDGLHIVNLGSVSNPVPPDLRASYVILNATPSGYQVEFRRVAYNCEAVVDAVHRMKHPAAAHITRLMRGEHQFAWQQQKRPRLLRVFPF